MTHDQLQEELSIIKKMIEKTRRETAESGLLFIIPGIFLLVAVIIMMILETFELYGLMRPAMFITMALTAIISFVIGYTEDKREQIQSYPKKLFAQLWIASVVPFLLTGVVFPLTHVFTWNLLPVFAFIILGIGIYMTGAIYEVKMIQYCAVLFWVGACALAYIKAPFHLPIVLAVLFFGYVLPGLLLYRQYKKRSKENES